MPHDAVHDSRSNSCCGQTAEGATKVATPPHSAGRSFRVNGLDCAEEVTILSKVAGPEVGGSENLAFDVTNGRMTVLEGATPLSDDRIIKIFGSTGMSAKMRDAAEPHKAEHFKRQRLFTSLSAGF